MKGRICLITGANSGIGKELALGLAAQGADLILVCRNMLKGQAVLAEVKAASTSKKVDLIIADLSSQAELRLLSQTLHERYSALHVLINNAGLVLREKAYSVDKIEMILAVNYLAPFLLSHLLLDLLQAGAPSRIINVSSELHQWARLDLNDLQFEQRKYHWVKAYGQSKLLMNLASFEAARRLAGTGVTVNCLHPGAVKTNLGSSSATNPFLKGLEKIIKFFFITPQAGAQTPLYLATSPQIEKITGQYFVKGKTRLSRASAYTREEIQQVWEISEKLAGLSQP